jgi:hypothetical protein
LSSGKDEFDTFGTIVVNFDGIAHRFVCDLLRCERYSMVTAIEKANIKVNW